MEYKNVRPWIWTFAAVAFAAAALWFAKPAGERSHPQRDGAGPTESELSDVPLSRADEPPASIGPLVQESRSDPLPTTSPEDLKPAEPEAVEPKEELTVEQLQTLLEGLIKKHDVDGVKLRFPQLQALGPSGIAAAAGLIEKLLTEFSDAEVDLPRPAPPAGWATLPEWVELFSPELVRYVLAERNPLGPVVEVLAHLYLRESWDSVDRATLAGEFILSEKVDSTHWPRYMAMLALQHMPGKEAGDYASRYLEQPPVAGYETVRYGAVWVIARRGWDPDWALIEQLVEKDPDETVRGTAKYHLLARGVTERGLLVVGLEADASAGAGGLMVGDVIKKVNGTDIDYLEDMPESYPEDATFVVNRYGATMTFKLLAGRHGIDGRHVPPAFYK